MDSYSEIIAFAHEHHNEDPLRLLLQQQRYPTVNLSLVAQQLEGQRQASVKWPTLASCDDYFYPPKLNREQSSSEATACYKAQLFLSLGGGTLADLTGGMGIDTLFQGIIIAALTLASYFIGISHAGVSLAEAVANDQAGLEGMTMAFLTLSMVEMFHSLNMRSRLGSIFKLPTQNGWAWGAFALALLLTWVVIETPLSQLFHFAELDLVHYGIAMALGISHDTITSALSAVPQVPGRLEHVKAKADGGNKGETGCDGDGRNPAEPERYRRAARIDGSLFRCQRLSRGEEAGYRLHLVEVGIVRSDEEGFQLALFVLDKAPPPAEAAADDFRFHPATGVAWVGGRPVALTSTEVRLLQALVSRPGVARSRAELLLALLGDEAGSVQPRTVDSAVCDLRAKLGSARWRLETAWGRGYRWNDASRPPLGVRLVRRRARVAGSGLLGILFAVLAARAPRPVPPAGPSADPPPSGPSASVARALLDAFGTDGPPAVGVARPKPPEKDGLSVFPMG